MRTARRAPALLLALGCAVACGRRDDPAPTKGRLPASPKPAEEEVVATVNGRPVTIAQVAEQVRATGKLPAEALEDIVRGEALAQLADERGLASDPEVQRRAREEMVRRYLQGDFEKEATIDNTVGAAEIRRAYQAALPRLVHPALKQVHHILVRTRGADERAAALAEELRGRVLGLKGAEDLPKLAEELKGRARDLGFELLTEQVVTAREGWTEEPFAQAAFALSKQGDVSSVVRTSYGYHVLRLDRDIAAEKITFDQALPTIRKDLYPRARAREFQRWLERQGARHQAAMYPDRLGELQQAEQAGR